MCVCVDDSRRDIVARRSAEWWAANRCNKLPEWQLIPLICDNRLVHTVTVKTLTHTQSCTISVLANFATHLRLSPSWWKPLLFKRIPQKLPRQWHADHSPGTPAGFRCCHGPLGQGAVPQLHDRLNHCVADVAAGEDLPGLKPGGLQERRWAGGSRDGGIMSGGHQPRDCWHLPGSHCSALLGGCSQMNKSSVANVSCSLYVYWRLSKWQIGAKHWLIDC